jgi:hypothetical protein
MVVRHIPQDVGRREDSNGHRKPRHWLGRWWRPCPPCGCSAPWVLSASVRYCTSRGNAVLLTSRSSPGRCGAWRWPCGRWSWFGVLRESRTVLWLFYWSELHLIILYCILQLCNCYVKWARVLYFLL